MIQENAILNELSSFREQLHSNKALYQPYLRLSVWQPIRDIAMDWIAILLSVTAVQWNGWWSAPIFITLIGNRQRALGNILHDAGHRNLHRVASINDHLTNLLVAPLLFVCLKTYRTTHFLHHLHLGDPEKDPDYLAPPASVHASWVRNFAIHAFSFRAWWGSLAGHLGAGMPIGSVLYVVSWWVLFCSVMSALFGPAFTVLFLALWLIARATTFHLITVFREMCDHYGLKPQGVIPFTRDIVQHNLWSVLFHPRNNGYHLTHHLLPATPYYNLPDVQRLVSAMPMYQAFDNVFSSYTAGTKPVATGWTVKASES